MPGDIKDILNDWGIDGAHDSGFDKTIKLIRAGDLGDETAESWQKTIEWIARGNVLWVMGLGPSQPVAGLSYEPLKKERLPVKINKNVKITDGLLNQYLYWTERYSVYDYKFAPLILPAPWVFRIPAEEVKGQGVPAPDLSWQALTDPALIVSAKVGKGFILLDTMDWGEILKRKYMAAPVSNEKARLHVSSDTPGSGAKGPAPAAVVGSEENQERAVRLFSNLLTNLGAQLKLAPVLQIEAENMTDKTPGQPVIFNRYHHYWRIVTNNYLAQEFEFPPNSLFRSPEKEEKKMVIDVKARSFLPLEIPPRMQVYLDEKIIGETDVREPYWQVYRFETEMDADLRQDSNPAAAVWGKEADGKEDNSDYKRQASHRGSPR